MDEEDPCSIGRKISGLFPFVQIAMRVVVVLIPVVFSLLRRLSFRGEATFRTKTDVKNRYRYYRESQHLVSKLLVY